MVNVSADQIQQLLTGNNQAIADAIAAAVQAVVPAIQGAQAAPAGAGGAGGGPPGGNGGDPFAKRLKAFHDVGVVRFAGDEGPIAAFKWISHAERMVFRLESVPSEQARRELVSHQMIGNALAWWQGVEASLGAAELAAMTIADFRALFEAQYVPDSSREQMRDQFRELRQGGMSVQAYARKFTELSLFAPEDVATDALRVSRFKRGLRDDIRLLCRTPRPLSYSELLNMALGVEDDQASVRKSSAASRGGFSGRGAFRHRGHDRAVPYDQARQGGGQRDRRDGFKGGRGGQRGGGFRGGFQQGNRAQRAFAAQPLQARAQPLQLPPPPVAALPVAQQQGQQQQRQGQAQRGQFPPFTCHECGDPNHYVRQCPRLQGVQQQQPHGQGGARGRGRGRDGRGGGRRGQQQHQGARGVPNLAALPGQQPGGHGVFQADGALQQDGGQ